MRFLFQKAIRAQWGCYKHLVSKEKALQTFVTGDEFSVVLLSRVRDKHA